MRALRLRPGGAAGGAAGGGLARGALGAIELHAAIVGVAARSIMLTVAETGGGGGGGGGGSGGGGDDDDDGDGNAAADADGDAVGDAAADGGGGSERGGEGGGRAGGVSGGGGGGAATSYDVGGTAATAQGRRVRRRPRLREQTVAIDLRAGAPGKLHLTAGSNVGSTHDKDPFLRAHTRDCFDLRVTLRDVGGFNVSERLEPGLGP